MPALDRSQYTTDPAAQIKYVDAYAHRAYSLLGA